MKFPLPLVMGISLVQLGPAPANAAEPVTVKTGQAYHGWSDAVVLANGKVEVIVVPSVGRVMQFRFAGEADGPFWENPRLAGQPMPEKPWEIAVGSFGGDKTWPAPQSLWNWPPPDIFDAAPLTFHVEADRSVILTSPVSARFGIGTERRIRLPPDSLSFQIVTTYKKVSGPSVEAGVWTITQAKDPVAVFVPVPAGSSFPNGLAKDWPLPEKYLTIADRLVRLTRGAKDSHKIGNDAASIAWIGEKLALRIDLEKEMGATYPDHGCSAEVYTNGDPVPYVELELLAPLHLLKNGDLISATNTYTLFHRDATEAAVQARKILAH